MPAEDGRLSATLDVRAEGFYSVELAMDDGTLVEASPRYTIDLLTDDRITTIHLDGVDAPEPEQRPPRSEPEPAAGLFIRNDTRLGSGGTLISRSCWACPAYSGTATRTIRLVLLVKLITCRSGV